jgi:hypothetical protein
MNLEVVIGSRIAQCDVPDYSSGDGGAQWPKPRVIGSIVQIIEVLWTLYPKYLWECAFKMPFMLG